MPSNPNVLQTSEAITNLLKAADAPAARAALELEAGGGGLPSWFDGSGTGYNAEAAFSLDADGCGGVDGSVSVGSTSNGSDYGAAVGSNSSGCNYGAAVGSNSSGSNYGAAVGNNARGSEYGAAVGSNSSGSEYGAAVGHCAQGSNYGVAVGHCATVGAAINRVEIAPADSGCNIRARASAHSTTTAWQFTLPKTDTVPGCAYQAFGNVDGTLPVGMWTAQLNASGTALKLFVNDGGVIKTGTVAVS